jgi:uncharacterized protein
MKRSIFLKFAQASVFVTLVSGCGTQSTQTQTQIASPESVQSEYETLLSRARATNDPKLRSELFLQATQALIAQGLSAQANYAFTEVDPLFLIGKNLNQYQILSLELSLAGENQTLIKERLEKIQLDQLMMSPISDQQKLIKLVTAGYERAEQPLRAAILLAEYEGIFVNDSASFLNERIWLLLQQTSTEALMRHSYQGNNADVNAWLELSKNIKLTQASLDQQYAALIRWTKDYPNHPAAKDLPLELELLSRLPETSPRQIVLALPLSGPYANVGQAVSDGFLANYFSNRTYEHSLEIKLFDTNSNPMSSLYQELERTQPLGHNTLVVGPLEKNRIAELSNSEYLNTPTLALNHSDEILPHPLLSLFGLDPSDETLQVAEGMSKQKLLRVAVIAPETEWGKRLSEVFEQQFTRSGGHVVELSLYKDQKNLADSVAGLLSTRQSKERARDIMRITGQRLETEPRRRQDIDAVFMLADNKTAKQIKPMLAFNFARDIPVYAISQTHDPFTRDENRDLNGILFVDIPWMLSRTSPLRSQIEDNVGQDAERYARFYALGADAYTLAPRIELLTEIQNSHVQGYTGTLSMGDQGKIKRSLQWAKFSRGSVKILN